MQDAGFKIQDSGCKLHAGLSTDLSAEALAKAEASTFVPWIRTSADRLAKVESVRYGAASRYASREPWVIRSTLYENAHCNHGCVAVCRVTNVCGTRRGRRRARRAHPRPGK